MTGIRTSIVLDNDAAENRPSLDTEWRDFHSGTGGVWARKVRCCELVRVTSFSISLSFVSVSGTGGVCMVLRVGY